MPPATNGFGGLTFTPVLVDDRLVTLWFREPMFPPVRWKLLSLMSGREP